MSVSPFAARQRQARLGGNAPAPRASAILAELGDVVVVVNVAGVVEYTSAGLEAVLGYEPGPRTFDAWTSIVHTEDLDLVLARLRRTLDGAVTEPTVLRARHRDGHWVHLEVSGRQMRGEGPGRLVLCLRDVTGRVAATELAMRQLTHDEVAGVLNRRGLAEALEGFAGPGALEATVFRIDIDCFRRINEFYGHAGGDHCLRTVADRCRELAGPDALIGRIGADDFAVVVDRPEALTILEHANRFIEALEQPMKIAALPARLSVTVGAANGAGRQGIERALRDAEFSLFDAKASRAKVRMFNSWMRVTLQRDRHLEHALRTELEAPRSLSIHLQPVVATATRRIDSFEGLARWELTPDAFIPPSDFIRVGESTGLSGPLARHLLDLGIATLGSWHRLLGPATPTMALNVEARLLTAPAFIQDIRRLLERHGVPGQHLGLEITESQVMGDEPAARSAIERLKELGIKVAIDDFGTGYSSLAALRDLDVDVLKVDHAFVERLPHDGRTAALIAAIVGFAQRVGITTVAEGVETEEQAGMLAELGLDFLQGYLFGRPTTAPEAQALYWEQLPAT
jgi:diguanylate cyclase (GGDEF)-like protein/PAS domain S-box-containing protein